MKIHRVRKQKARRRVIAGIPIWIRTGTFIENIEQLKKNLIVHSDKRPLPPDVVPVEKT